VRKGALLVPIRMSIKHDNYVVQQKIKISSSLMTSVSEIFVLESDCSLIKNINTNDNIKYIANISIVSKNVKFMCMRLKNCEKGKVHRTFRQFCAEYI